MIGLSPYGKSDYLASLNNGTPCTRENFLFTSFTQDPSSVPVIASTSPSSCPPQLKVSVPMESLHSPNTPLLAGVVVTSAPVFPAPLVSRQEETVPHWLLYKLRGKESRKCCLERVGSLSLSVSATSFALSTHHQLRSCTKKSSSEPDQHSSDTSSSSWDQSAVYLELCVLHSAGNNSVACARQLSPTRKRKKCFSSQTSRMPSFLPTQGGDSCIGP